MEHDISIKSRKLIEVTGVESVERFDADEFVLTTGAGPLQIHGANLHMKHLDLQAGVAHIEGTVTQLAYVSERTRKRRMVKRLLK